MGLVPMLRARDEERNGQTQGRVRREARTDATKCSKRQLYLCQRESLRLATLSPRDHVSRQVGMFPPDIASPVVISRNRIAILRHESL